MVKIIGIESHCGRSKMHFEIDLCGGPSSSFRTISFISDYQVNVCWMNAVVQALSHLPEVTDAYRAQREAGEDEPTGRFEGPFARLLAARAANRDPENKFA